jgi:hypothetical protein
MRLIRRRKSPVDEAVPTIRREHATPCPGIALFAALIDVPCSQ